jgi:DNA-directed RNA polymerase specialized sigma24 family protein
MSIYSGIEATRQWQIGVTPISSFSFEQVKPRKLGIDLDTRSQDVRLIFYKRQAHSVSKEGLDPEDVLQEVYKGIMIRNEGSCPYDPEKSAFSTYVVMVMNCIVMNVINKHRKDSSKAMLGVEEDISSSHSHSMDLSYDQDPSDDMVMEEVRSRFKDDALKVYDAMMDGMKASHIAKTYGWDTRKVKNLVQEVRHKVSSYFGWREMSPC